jgi:hypothetical protein
MTAPLWTRTVEPFVLDLAYRDVTSKRRVVMGRLASLGPQGQVVIPAGSTSYVMDGQGLFDSQAAAQKHLETNRKHYDM